MVGRARPRDAVSRSAKGGGGLAPLGFPSFLRAFEGRKKGEAKSVETSLFLPRSESDLRSTLFRKEKSSLLRAGYFLCRRKYERNRHA